MPSDSRLERLKALANLNINNHEGRNSRQRIKAEILFTSRPVESVEKNFSSESIAEKVATEKVFTEEVIKETFTPKSTTDTPLREHYSDEYSDDNSTEDEPIQLLKPVFVPKLHRQEITEKVAENTHKEQEARNLLEQYIRSEYEASIKTTDDESNTFDPSRVDDTDDLDENFEIDAWKLRELLRVKRDRQERERFEREKMELERIRNLTEEERRKLDEEKMKEWIEQPRSQMKFMQKYYHKGAFFMDDNNSLMSRDYSQATGEDTSANREVLPDIKQVRNFGKKGRTKWTHLVGEDTTAFDYGWGQKRNDMNYKMIGKMGGMRGHLDNPSKKPKN